MLPAKIKGLNQDTSDESNDEEEETIIITKEALEQKTQQGYREALILQKQNKFSEAEKLLKELLQSNILVQAVGKVQYNNGKLQPSILHLKYCCYLNLGNILFKIKDYKSALDYYLKATELDDTDLNLWYKMGNVAMKIPNLMFAISAFMETLIRNPHHWPSLDSIISATYATGDYMATLLYISQGLKLDPHYLKGIILKDRIMKEHPQWVKDFKIFYPDNDLNATGEFDEEDVERIFQTVDKLISKDTALNVKLFDLTSKPVPNRGLLKPLKTRSWLCLGKSLLKLYKFLYDCDSDMAFFSNIDIKCAEDEKTCPKESEIDVTMPTVEESTPMEVDESKCKPENTNEDNETAEVEKANDEDDDDDVLTELVSVAPKLNENERDSNEAASKPAKRRKCSPTLADQLKICDKRRSTRNKTVLKSNEQSLSKTLKNLIPTSLLPEKDKISKSDCYDLLRWNEDSFDTMDIYRLLFEHQDQSSLPSHPINQFSEDARIRLLQEESYFGSEKEKSDVAWYISLNDEQMILELIEAYLRELATKWHLIWPSKLADIFVEMYQILVKHGLEGRRIKILESWDMKSDLDEESTKLLREKVGMVLLYGELLLNQCLEDSQKEQPLGSCLLGGDFSSLLFGDLHDACSILNAAEKDVKLWMRYHWLEALLFLQKKDTYATCCALSILLEEISDPDVEVRLPNMKQFHVISTSGAKRLLNTLNRNQNLNEVKVFFSQNQFDRVIEILQETLKPGSQELMYLPNENTLSRYQQYNLLFASLWESRNYEELFSWCEVGCYEAFAIYRKSFFDDVDSDMKSKWASLVMNTVNSMLSCLKTNGPLTLDTLKPEHLTRLVQTLSNLVCHQIEATEPSAEITADVVSPWILLANVINHNEIKENLSNSNDETGEVCILPSVSLLFVAHEHLGKRNWCCFDDGSLLFYTLNVIEPMFHNCVTFSETWVTLSQQIDQIFFCLYSHPFKRNRARHVQDHNSLGLALTWNRAIQAYSFYRPTTLPIYDASSKYCTISVDTETLLKRMVALVPEEQNPSRFVETMQDYMNSSHDNIPENENRLQDDVADLYYLLGDYYFKNKIMGKAIKYYSFDVCSNPYRVDSWAAMALARGSQLEMKLNSCETITNECEILKKAELTDKCYRTALKLDYYQSTLWIEFGVFCYGIHGFCSRLLKQENLSIEMFNMVEQKKNNFLKTAFMSFNNANEAWLELTARREEVQDERWLHHYMLGKIAEKKEENITISLNHYFEAAKFLDESGAEYPMRIVYSSPQYYSVEALEIYYRIHASILKVLESHEERPLDRVTVDALIKFVKKVDSGSFVKARINATKSSESATKNTEKPKESSTAPNIDNEKNNCDVDPDVKEFLEEIISQVVEPTKEITTSKRKPEEANAESEATPKKIKSDIQVAAENDVSATATVEKIADTMEVDEETAGVSEEPSESRSAGQVSSTQSRSSSVGSSTIGSSSSSSSGSSSIESSDSQDETDDSENGEKREIPCMDRTAWQEARKTLAECCIRSLEECMRRFPEHYKTFYRLAHHYFRTKLDRDIEKARKLLIEEGGLFADRTNKNFFGGIWRIPIGEIDRSGSFAYHMSRSVHLLIAILRDTQDYKTLLNMSTQLRCKPDLDKKYLRDNERDQISKLALSLSSQTLRKIIDDLPATESEENKRKLLLDVYKCYHRVAKNFSQKDAPFSKLLLAMFYKYTGRRDKISIDQILSFCKSLNASAKNPGGPPVLLPGLPPPPTASFMEESEVSKALTQVINMALNDSKPPLLNFSSPMHQSMMQKLSATDGRSSYRPPLPSNLKTLPSSISVTAVSKPKLSSQPTWDKNMLPMMPKLALVGKPQPKIKPLKRLTQKLDKPGVKSKPKEKQYKSKNLDFNMHVDKGLSITPVLKEAKAPALVAQVAGKASAKSQLPPAPKLTMNELLHVSKDNLGLVITPVENKNQPTLQQKLAAKQLANTARNSSGAAATASSKAASKVSSPSANKVNSPSFDIPRSIGSSGVSIFPLPVENAIRFGSREGQLAMAQFPRFLPNISGIRSPIPGKYAGPPKATKKPDAMNLNRLKAISKHYIEQASREKLKLHEQTLKSSFKALEANKDIVITPASKPKLPKSNEIEIINLNDNKK